MYLVFGCTHPGFFALEHDHVGIEDCTLGFNQLLHLMERLQLFSPQVQLAPAGR